MKIIAPPSYPEVDLVLAAMVPGLADLLAGDLIGIYIYGSLAYGGFDLHSDVDVLVVPREPIPVELFPALQVLHTRVAALPVWCATQLEVTYIHLSALRRYDPADCCHPYLGRNPGAHLKLVSFGPEWVVQRCLLRERGIILLGPNPRTLIDPVTPDDLRHAMRLLLDGRLAGLVQDPSGIDTRGYQSYCVLTVCRVLRTIQYGDVLSKPAAAAWAKTSLDPRWTPLIERAILSRQSPHGPPDPDEVRQTLAFIGYALERSRC